MAYLNKVLLIGNLTRDPELQYLPSGTALCKFDIAINRRFKDKDETTFLSIETWGKTAEFCKEYLAKGRSVFIDGRIKIDSWDAQDGTKRKRYVIVADSVGFADSKSSKSQSDHEENFKPSYSPEPNNDFESTNSNFPEEPKNESSSTSDDLPF